MNKEQIKNAIVKFKALRGRLILKVRQNMHYIQKEKDIAVYDKAIELGLNNIEATILANRTKDVENLEKYIHPRLSYIMDYNRLKDIDIATDLIIKHVNNNSHITLCTDVDCDGLDACAVLYIFLTEVLKYKNVSYILSERMYGNGLNDKLLEDITNSHNDKKIDLIIYADHCSSSGINVAKIMDLGIDSIVTDHHTLSPDNAPFKYSAFINPQRPDCDYDKSISGCVVAYLLCLSVADKLGKKRDTDEMHYMLSLAALTTISDSMRLDSITNRAIVRTGLNIVNMQKSKNWSRLKPDPLTIADYKTFGFQVAPMINSASRMGDAKAGLYPLILKDGKDILEATSKIIDLNTKRKNLQNELFSLARDMQSIEVNNKYTVVQIINKGLGIQGIISSMFTNSEMKPSMIFYKDTKNDLLQGSGRSARGVNLLEILRAIEKEHPNEVVKCGGHKEAAGFTIKPSFYDTFKKKFDDYVCIALNFDHQTTELEVKHNVDMEVDTLDYGLYKSIQLLSPYGQGWEEPVFITAFKLIKFTVFSRPKTSDIYTLTLLDGAGVQIVTTFFATGDKEIVLEKDMYIDIIYKVKYNPVFDKNIAMDILDIRASTKVIDF